MKMKSININGVKYFLAEDVKNKIKSLNLTKDERRFELISKEDFCFSPDMCTGVGTVILGSDSVVTRVSLDMLKRAIRFIESVDEYEGLTFAWGRDVPLCIGHRNKEKLTGFIVAPRVDN